MDQDDKRVSSSVPKKAPPELDSDWLNAYYDPVAGLQTNSASIELVDIFADGDSKFISATYGPNKTDLKLKVFKGASLIKESNLVDVPTGLISLYMDNLQPRVPAVAVASGSGLFVYKNLRPAFQFTLPSLDVNDIEKDIWNRAKMDSVDISAMHQALDDLRSNGKVELTVRSLMFLSLPLEEAKRYVDIFKNAELKRQATITCLGKMNKSSSDEDALNCLVVGTEHKMIHILDAQAFTILASMECPSVPVFLNVSGLYDVEFRIVAACRDGCLYVFKRGFKTPKATIVTPSQIVGIEKSGKNIIVGCMDSCLYCFSTKGKRVWKIELPDYILTMGSMEHKTKGITGIIVSLNNNEVHIYNDKYIISKFKTEDAVVGIKFGKFGREEGNLLMTTRSGGLIVKILKRNAALSDKNVQIGPPEAQLRKLDIPKKTKLYVDQTTRERDNAVAMHLTFEQELYKFRIKAAREFLKSLSTASTPVSTNPNEPLRLNAQVQGIGPKFKILLKVQNISQSNSCSNLFITFQYDSNLYKMLQPYLKLPMLVPGLEYPFSAYAMAISDQLISDNIKVLLCKENCQTPIITAVISMPVSEAEIIA